MELERKSIDEMTKAELKRELDGLRCEYDTLKVKDDIIKILDRMPTSIELEEIRKYAEKVYQKSIDKSNWLGGARVCTLKECTKCKSVLQRKLSASLKRVLRMLTLPKWGRSWI